jgi:hypothetical protein
MVWKEKWQVPLHTLNKKNYGPLGNFAFANNNRMLLLQGNNQEKM